MKPLTSTLLLILWLAGSVFAQQPNTVTSYKIAHDHEVGIKGTSSLHDWHSTVENVSGTAQLSVSGNELTAVSGLNITMEVKSIKSGKNAMDKNTYEAMNASTHPYINYKLEEVKSIGLVKGKYVLQTLGNLTIAGKTQGIHMEVNATLNNGNIAFEGSKSINMKDYDIEPPTAVFGTIKTGGTVEIIFKVMFEKSSI